MSPSHRPSDDERRLQSQALAWFVRRRDAGWTSVHESAFQAWLAENPRHAAAYLQCEEPWQVLDHMPPDLLARMRRNLGDDAARLAARGLAQRPMRRRILLRSALGISTIAAAGGAGYVAWQLIQAQPIYMQTFVTRRGQQQKVQLTDGSRAWLDTATRLEIAYYRQRREVRLLNGQAVFDVQPDARRPFHVLAEPLRATAVGTRFSVRRTPELAGNNGVQVGVEEGKVRVARAATSGVRHVADDQQAGILLGAGQQIAADAQGELGAISAVSADGIAPWREQRISFVDVPLAHALVELERYRATALVVRDPKVAALRLSGTFDPMASDLTLRKALQRVLPVRLREQDGRIELLPAD